MKMTAKKYDAYCPTVTIPAAATDAEKMRLEMLRRLVRTAHRLHKNGKTPFRHQPDERPYIVHPQAVVGLLEEWGYDCRDDFVTVAVGWGHDLIEETVDAAATEAAIRKAIFADVRLADEVVAGIRALSFAAPETDPEKTQDENNAIYDAAKREYILNIARTAPINVLVVKMADRLCNTMDFLEAGNLWAKNYLEQGRCLFERTGEAKDSLAVERTLKHVQDEIGRMFAEVKG